MVTLQDLTGRKKLAIWRWNTRSESYMLSSSYPHRINRLWKIGIKIQPSSYVDRDRSHRTHHHPRPSFQYVFEALSRQKYDEPIEAAIYSWKRSGVEDGCFTAILLRTAYQLTQACVGSD